MERLLITPTNTLHSAETLTPTIPSSTQKDMQGQHTPEESLAAFTRHSVKVKASGLVTTHAADPRGVAVKLVRSDHRRRHRHGFHHCPEVNEREKRLEPI